MTPEQRAAMAELLARVEAGDFSAWAIPDNVSNLIDCAVMHDDVYWHDFVQAYDGYLDDAMALLAYLLPGAYLYIMGPSVDGWHAGVTAPDMPCLWCYHPTLPARALLIATLKAKLGDAT